jgi:large subunit ribosomal protein L6
MNKLIKKYNIKIPKDIAVIYSKKKRTLTLIGPQKIKSIKLQIQIFINQPKKIINVSPLGFSQISNTEKKKTRILQNTTLAQIKYMLIESSMLVYKKLKINGVGYRTNFTENFNQHLLTFKLGYSHFIYIRASDNLTVNCLTKTKLCIFGNSYENISQFAALVRSHKTPEPYKGKGILYDNERIEIKEGKKV